MRICLRATVEEYLFLRPLNQNKLACLLWRGCRLAWSRLVASGAIDESSNLSSPIHHPRVLMELFPKSSIINLLHILLESCFHIFTRFKRSKGEENIKKAFAIFFLALLSMVMILSATLIPAASAASQTDINTAIDKGLAYLASIQAGDGHWGGAYYVACTSMAVLAFENAGFHAGDGSIYALNVQNGLNYLFSTAHIQAIGVQPAGDPDTNGNGMGIYFNDPWGQVIYQTPMVLMAIVGSQTQTAVATTGPVNVIGRTYYDIVVDIVDYLAWAQNDYGNGRGGWRYGPNYDGSQNSDNSISQWPTLGLMTAELWGINAPSFVKGELLNYWVTYAQNLGGTPTSNYYYGAFAYAANEWGPGTLQTIAETGAGILQLTYCGVPKTDPRVIAAEGFMNRDWLTSGGPYGWSVNLGNFYAMYAVMKAARLTTPTPIQFLANYDGSPGVEWYNGAGEYADQLVSHQYANGHWSQWVAPEYVPDELCTAFGVLILEFVPVVVHYSLTVTVLEAITGDPIEGAAVLAEGPETHSGDTGSDGTIVFDPVQAGTYTVTVTEPGHMPSPPQVVGVFSDTEVPPIELTPSINQVIPEVPIGTIAVSASMIMALLGFLALPRLRKKIH